MSQGPTASDRAVRQGRAGDGGRPRPVALRRDRRQAGGDIAPAGPAGDGVAPAAVDVAPAAVDVAPATVGVAPATVGRVRAGERAVPVVDDGRPDRAAATALRDPDRAAATAMRDADHGPAADVAIDATRLRVALARLSRRLRRHQLAGLTPTQLSALATVEKGGPIRLGDLAAAEGIAPSTLTRLVAVLEDAGHVRRCAVPEDARASVLLITPQGREVLGRIRDESTTLLARMLTLLSAGERASIAAALPALEQLAGADPREPQPGGQQAR